MVGQTTLISTIDNLIEGNKFPQYVVLEGMKGSGRSLISKYIAKNIGADFIEIEDLKIASIREVILDARENSFKKLYFLRDVEGMNTQSANAILKLVEEPPKGCYIIMSVENVTSLLATLQSRAKIMKMDNYTPEELREFTSSSTLIAMCNTPGMIKLFEQYDADDTIAFADKIINNVARVSIMNMFAILNYIDVAGKDDSKYNRNLILKALEYRVTGDLKTAPNKNLLAILYKIHEVQRFLLNPSMNKQGLFDSLLLTMREVLKIES